MTRTVGHLYPEWFTAQLTDKDGEAVANPARFADLGRSKREMAAQDYEAQDGSCLPRNGARAQG